METSTCHLLCSGLPVAGLLFGVRLAHAASPNVVLIMTDNRGARTLGCYGIPVGTWCVPGTGLRAIRLVPVARTDQ